jgi:hypothetical protein
MCEAGCQGLRFRVSLEGLTFLAVVLFCCISLLVFQKISDLEGVMNGTDHVLGIWKQAVVV